MDEFCSAVARIAKNATGQKVNSQELQCSSCLQSSNEDVVHLTKKEQTEALAFKRGECLCKMYEEPSKITGTYCNRTWDNIMCWEDTPAGQTAYQPCPAYINNFRIHYNASRTCLPNGFWASHPFVNGSDVNGWTNYTACQYNGTGIGIVNRETEDVPHIIREQIHKLRLMYNIGYAISLASLIVAFIIMVYFRKLHCSRNTIHLHLFASFIFRAAISLIRDNFMVGGIGFSMDVTYNDTGGIVIFKDGPHWECRLFFAIFQYTLAASHVWIFTEAVYLHMLIFVSVFTERLKVKWFVMFGWLFPLVFVLAWCVARYLSDNTFCWNTHNNRPGLIWIVQSPIMVTIVLNFAFFINIIRVLYTKLRSPQCSDTKKTRYRRLARSTLFLVPTFGVYYILFTIPVRTDNDTFEFVVLFIEMFFNSFQGFFIALVLCFINAEVRVQIRKSFERSKWCPCCKLIGTSNRTDYLRCHSVTQAESKKENINDVNVELADLHNGKQELNGHNISINEQEPFLKTNDNYVLNGGC